MSLVLEALRRVEKSDARTGSIGVAVASYRPLSRRGRSWAPLLLGLIVGGIAVLLFGPSPGGLATSRAGDAGAPASRGESLRALGGAGLPAPLILADAGLPPRSKESAEVSQAVAAKRRPTLAQLEGAPSPDPLAAAARGLVLQAISERDSRAIAVISDQLVREGDLIGKARVLKIGADAVEVLFEGGGREVIRFPIPPDPTPTPDGH